MLIAIVVRLPNSWIGRRQGRLLAWTSMQPRCSLGRSNHYLLKSGTAGETAPCARGAVGVMGSLAGLAGLARAVGRRVLAG